MSILLKKKLNNCEVKKEYQIKPKLNKLACFSLEKTWAHSLMRGNADASRGKSTKRTNLQKKNVCLLENI